MKLFALVSAGLIATAGLAAGPAQAQHEVVHTRVVTHTRGHTRWKTVCRTHWYHHRKVRRCRRVRMHW